MGAESCGAQAVEAKEAPSTAASVFGVLSLMGLVMFWVPQSGRLGIGISIISYDGGVMLGVATDARLVPDPEHIVEAFKVEFEAMRGAAAKLGKPTKGRLATTR